MPNEPKDAPAEPRQRTPEGAEREAVHLPGKGGHEIPVPRKVEVLGDLERVVRNAERRRREQAEDEADAEDATD